MSSFITPEIVEAEKRIQTALQKLRIVYAPASVAKWTAEYEAAKQAHRDAYDALTAANRAELAALSDEALIGRYKNARAYSYEATMGDYSAGSISRAGRELSDAKAVLEARGIDPASIPFPSYL